MRIISWILVWMVTISLIAIPISAQEPNEVESIVSSSDCAYSPECDDNILKGFSDSSEFFITNEGQISESDILFYSSSGNAFFTKESLLFRISEIESISEIDPSNVEMKDNLNSAFQTEYRERGVVLQYSFVNANNVIPIGKQECSWKSNFFSGNDENQWHTNIPNYMEIIYPDLWDGVDLVYRLMDGKLKYDLILAPGADPDQIQFEIEGNTNLRMKDNGDMIIETEHWDIVDTGLIANYNDERTGRIDVDFRITQMNRFGFSLGDYDNSQEVIIDPLIYSTYIGGTNHDSATGIEVDSNGNAYIVGSTKSTDYPTTTGAYDTSSNLNYDVFVTKLNPAGTSLIYSTFIGGSGTDLGGGIKIDSNGNAFIVGRTYDSDTDYPTTNGAYDRTHNGMHDIFVTKLNPSGSSLLYSTYIGGSDFDFCFGIDINMTGDAFITGYSTSSNFPTTSGAFDRTHNGANDVIVSKLNSAGSSLVYSTYIGGRYDDYGRGIKVDSNGNPYIVGFSDDANPGYPTTTGAYNTNYNGNKDVFATKLNSAGSSLVYSTLIGGSGDDCGYGIDIDTEGNSYITGYTEDSTTDYPVTSGSYDSTHNGRFDVFVTKLNSSGSSLNFSTYLGSGIDDYGYGIVVDNMGNSYITGNTAAGYPRIVGVYDPFHNGGRDAYLTKLNSSGASLDYSTFIGGSNDDYSHGLSLDTIGNAYVTGRTISEDNSNDFPTSNGAYDVSYNGGDDIFVTKLDFSIDTIPPVLGIDYSDTSGTTGDPFNLSIEVTDNIGVGVVYVEYWFGDGQHRNVSMDGTGIFYKNIITPTDAIEIHYIFRSRDEGGIWAIGTLTNATIYDNDRPIFKIDESNTTGTTGGTFRFSVSVTDNMIVDEVDVEYWFDSGSHINVSFIGSNPYSMNISVLKNAQILNYMFHARDPTGNWNQTILKEITITDNEHPIFRTDNSDTIGTTGEMFNFSIDVSDNVGLTSVYVEYYFGNGSISNVSMIGVGPYTYSIYVPKSSDDDLYYHFFSTDIADNMNVTTPKKIQIHDNDAPIFEKDESDQYGIIGELLNFSIELSDNIGISEVYLEYWYGNGTKTNVSMSGANPFLYSIIVQTDSLDPFHYIFHSMDESGNWNHTTVVDISIMEYQLPVFSADENSGIGTTGEYYIFSIEVEDNIAVSDVNVVYWFGTGEKTNITMVGTDLYTHTISIPSNSDDDLYYYFISVDTAGNWNQTAMRAVNISDNDLPIFGTDISDLSGTTGEAFNVNIDVSDNIGISEAYIEYWFGEGQHENVTMSGINTITFSISIPLDSVDPFNYIVHVKDINGNWNQTSVKSISILDNDGPLILEIEDISISLGEEVNIKINASDNIGIVKYEWINSPIESTSDLLQGIPEEPGTYNIILIVHDQNGNNASIQFTISVEPLEKDDNGSDNNGSWLWVLLLIMPIVLLLIGLIVFFVVRKKKQEEELPQEAEHIDYEQEIEPLPSEDADNIDQIPESPPEPPILQDQDENIMENDNSEENKDSIVEPTLESTIENSEEIPDFNSSETPQEPD